MRKEPVYDDLDPNNPALSAFRMYSLLGLRANRCAKVSKFVPKSTAFAEDFAYELARFLNITQRLASHILDAIGYVGAERLKKGKALGFPGLGVFYIHTMSEQGRHFLRRKVRHYIPATLQRKIRELAPITESFNEQYRKAREKFIERKRIRKEILLSGGRRRHRDDD